MPLPDLMPLLPMPLMRYCRRKNAAILRWRYIITLALAMPFTLLFSMRFRYCLLLLFTFAAADCFIFITPRDYAAYADIIIAAFHTILAAYGRFRASGFC